MTQPTIIYDSSQHGRPAISSDRSQPHVGFVAGQQPHFADETATLLRSRLTSGAMVLALVLTAAFVGGLRMSDEPLRGPRVGVILTLVISAVILRSRYALSYRQLRAIELIIFGVVAAQLLVMPGARLIDSAAKGDAATCASYRANVFASWIILILAYGIIMPNTWRRAAVILFPLAALPYGLFYYLSWRHPELGVMLAQDRAEVPLPLPFVAAAIAVSGAHAINSIRREAFNARKFGQYRLLERLGAGGMGEVFKAEHILLKRPCAIKLLKAASEADATAIARFEKEVQATARLTHWNTVEIYDYGRTDDGTFYYVMELLPGMSLEELVQSHGPLPPGRAVHLLLQVCAALEEAHAAGVIHRDIKPANIFVAQRGGVFDVIKLLDFGLVKETAELSPDERRKDITFSGTPLYMAPEQAASYEDVDGRADIYSLGAVAYFLLTGLPPFTGNTVEVLMAHAQRSVTAPSTRCPGLSSDIDQIVLRCLAKEPAQRFASARELKAALSVCSAAGTWSAQAAADWWRNLQPAPAKTEPLLGGAAAGVAATIDSWKDQPTRGA